MKYVTNYEDLFIWKRTCRIHQTTNRNIFLCCIHTKCWPLRTRTSHLDRVDCSSSTFRVPSAECRHIHAQSYTHTTNQEKWPIKVVLCWWWRWRAYATNNYWQIVTKSIVGGWVAGCVLTPNVQVTHFCNEKARKKTASTAIIQLKARDKVLCGTVFYCTFTYVRSEDLLCHGNRLGN